MTPERWREVEEIFHRALAVEGEERRRLLDSACDDDDLRAEVESLLLALGDSMTFDRGAVPRLTRDLLERAPDLSDETSVMGSTERAGKQMAEKLLAPSDPSIRGQAVGFGPSEDPRPPMAPPDPSMTERGIGRRVAPWLGGLLAALLIIGIGSRLLGGGDVGTEAPTVEASGVPLEDPDLRLESADPIELLESASRYSLAYFETVTEISRAGGIWAHALGMELLRRGELLVDIGDTEAAARVFSRSIEVQEAALSARTGDPPMAWLDGLASAYQSLADLDLRRDEPRGALEKAERALAIRLQIRLEVGNEGGDSPQGRISFAKAMVFVGELRAELGDVAGGRRDLDGVGEILDGLGAEGDLEPELQNRRALIEERAQRLGRVLADAASGTSAP